MRKLYNFYYLFEIYIMKNKNDFKHKIWLLVYLYGKIEIEIL